jgi:hypothetical protein
MTRNAGVSHSVHRGLGGRLAKIRRRVRAQAAAGDEDWAALAATLMCFGPLRYDA